MEAKIISTLRWLNVEAEPNIYEMMPGISIVNDPGYIRESLDSDFAFFAGRIEYEHLLEVDHLIVCRPEESSIWEGYNHSEPAVFCWLLWLSMLIEDSWLVKDNAIGCELAHCRFDNGSDIYWSSNGLYAQLSKTDGQTLVPTVFDQDEVQSWGNLSFELRDHLHGKGFSVFDSPVSKKSTRFNRFLSFMASSRTMKHPSLKIAQICSALESLFSTSSSELTHRLSERVSHFLGGSSATMEERYQFMKKAYGIRSQVTHGSHIKASDIEASSGISQSLQDLCREIVFMVLRDPEKEDVVYGSNEKIEDYFRKQLFRC